MGEVDRNGMRRDVFAQWVGAILLLAVLQSAVHLEVVLESGRIDTIVDLDRSNGVPDVISSLALAGASVAAMQLARLTTGRTRALIAALAAGLAFLTLADLVHAGPHPDSSVGPIIIVLVVGVGILLLGVSASSGERVRATLALAGCFLIASFLVSGLDKIDPGRFDRERPDPIAEYQIVAKEGFELIGWSLVALALWDEAFRRRRVAGAATAPASRARASSRRRAA